MTAGHGLQQSGAPSLGDLATSRFATVEFAGKRIQVHYQEVGNTGRATPWIVLLHGSGPGATAWGSFQRNIHALVGDGHRALLIDLPGWGKSDSIVCSVSRPDLNAHVVKSLLDTLGIHQRVHVIGSSMGAHTSLALALASPDRVDRLVLIAGGSGSLPGSEPSEGAKRIHAFYRNPCSERLRELLEITTASKSHLTADFIHSRLNHINGRPDHLAAFVASLDAQPRQFPDVSDRLGEVHAQTLLVWGREDRVVSVEVGLRIFSGLRHAHMHLIGNCGHVPHQEHPEIFNRLALDFLAS